MWPEHTAPPRAAAMPRVLLVEDHLDAAESMVMFLEICGYSVIHAATCAAALQAVEAHPFDIVLTDIGLPDGSGIDLGRTLSRRMPVVALTGFGTRQDMQQSIDAGFSGHLVKPADPDAVHAMLQNVLARHALA
jgi:DNA-binding response OmpR family regulator